MIQKYKKMASWSKRIQGIEFTLNSLQGLQTLQQWLNHPKFKTDDKLNIWSFEWQSEQQQQKLWAANNGNALRSDIGSSHDQRARIIILKRWRPTRTTRNPVERRRFKTHEPRLDLGFGRQQWMQFCQIKKQATVGASSMPQYFKLIQKQTKGTVSNTRRKKKVQYNIRVTCFLFSFKHYPGLFIPLEKKRHPKCVPVTIKAPGLEMLTVVVPTCLLKKIIIIK